MIDRLTAGSTSEPTDRFALLVSIVRIMLGIEFIANGLNWWIKIIGPYPSISDYAHGEAVRPGLVGAMIATGFLFHVVKATELVAGIGLLANRWVPLCLVVAFPVTVNVFFVDVLISTHLRAHIMGTGAMLMSVFLMIAYFYSYAPMLAMRTRPQRLAQSIDFSRRFLTPPASVADLAVYTVGFLSALFGAVMLTWVGVMIFQTFVAQ